MSYLRDRAWSDRFIPAIKAIVGPHLLRESSFEEDTKRATDLVVLQARGLMIACRVRRPGYADRYPYEFTIRSHRDSGAATELEKVTNGWGDWMFYGHARDDDSIDFARWFLLDLAGWRAHMIRRTEGILRGTRSNADGTSFAWFDMRSFPAEPRILVASSHPLPETTCC